MEFVTFSFVKPGKVASSSQIGNFWCKVATTRNRFVELVEQITEVGIDTAFLLQGLEVSFVVVRDDTTGTCSLQVQCSFPVIKKNKFNNPIKIIHLRIVAAISTGVIIILVR